MPYFIQFYVQLMVRDLLLNLTQTKLGFVLSLFSHLFAPSVIKSGNRKIFRIRQFFLGYPKQRTRQIKPCLILNTVQLSAFIYNVAVLLSSKFEFEGLKKADPDYLLTIPTLRHWMTAFMQQVLPRFWRPAGISIALLSSCSSISWNELNE